MTFQKTTFQIASNKFKTVEDTDLKQKFADSTYYRNSVPGDGLYWEGMKVKSISREIDISLHKEEYVRNFVVTHFHDPLVSEFAESLLLTSGTRAVFNDNDSLYSLEEFMQNYSKF
jgi:hypothetical protein